MPSRLLEYWGLDRTVNFLNHGSFGACPTAVLNHQSVLRARIERQPVQFFLRDIYELIDDARSHLAQFLDAKSSNLVFVRNATEGINAVLRSISLEAGDEILITNHGYPACKNVVDHVAKRHGARVVVAEFGFRDLTPASVHQTIMNFVTKRTKVALIDHVTSPTGIVLPVETLVPALESAGVMTLVDGAHGPGMLDLSMTDLNPSFYVGNLHKWVCAPKGAAFLYLRDDRQEGIHPATISHGYSLSGKVLGRSITHLEFDWTGTQDPTAWLCVPKAIDFMAHLYEGGWPAIRARNRQLVLEARQHLALVLGVDIPTTNEMIGHLAALPIPPSDEPVSHLYGTPFQDRLLNEFGIEVPIVPWPQTPHRLVRVSAALYNDFDDYIALGQALEELLPC
jgi:isopenicillin-N epimerase